MKRLALVLALPVLLAACRKEETKAVTDTTSATKPMVSPFDSIVAVFAHGGHVQVDSTRRSIVWLPAPEDSLQGDGGSRDTLRSVVLTDTSLVPEERIVLLATAPLDFSCHGCSPYLSLLLRKGSTWSFARRIGQLGSFGEIPHPAQLLRLPDGRTLIAFEDGFSNMGSSEENLSLFLLDPASGVHTKSFASMGASNLGACDSVEGDCWSWESKVDWKRSPLPRRLMLQRLGKERQEDGSFLEKKDTVEDLDWKPAF